MKRHNPVKLVLVGGGSGGHIIPLITLSKHLKQHHPDWRLTYIGDRRNRISSDLIDGHQASFGVRTIFSGKFRRYSGFKGWKKLKLWREYALNLLDFFRIIIGCCQSLILLLIDRPTLVFSKGGVSALSVCIPALLLRIPVVTHDSDATSSLTHRLIARHTRLHLTGSPVKKGVGSKKSIYVGVPVNSSLRIPLKHHESQAMCDKYDLPRGGSRLMMVIGGGQGARSINRGVLGVVNDLSPSQEITILILTGKGNYQEAERLSASLLNPKVTVCLAEFSTDVPALLKLSNWVITRAGATALAEVAAAKKPAIIIPNPVLPASHQVHNAEAYKSAEAALIVGDTGHKVDSKALKRAMNTLFEDAEFCNKLKKNIAKLTIDDASDRILRALEGVVQAK